MCLTKTGASALPQYLWKGVVGVKDFFKNLPGRFPVRAGKAVGGGFAKGVSGLAGAAVKGTAGAAKFVYNKPHIAIPLLGLGYLAAKKLPDNIYKNMYHVDPKYNLTRSNAIGQIKYNDPSKEEQYKHLSLFNI